MKSSALVTGAGVFLDSHDAMRSRFGRLFAAVVKPTVAYGCEIWGTLCVGSMGPEFRKMAEIQLAFYRQILRLKKAVPAHLILAELDEVPWVGSWWSQILGFLQKLGNLAGDALHAEFCETMCMMHGWTPHVAVGQQGLIRCTPVLACSPPGGLPLPWSGWGGCCRLTHLQEEHG